MSGIEGYHLEPVLHVLKAPLWLWPILKLRGEPTERSIWILELVRDR